MRTTLRRTRASLLGVAVMAALGFGASSAMADVSPTAACPNPDSWCTITSDCPGYCKAIGAGTGQCSRGCCYCIWF